jgi:putative lipoic acid-binding regulatory protein
MRFPARDVCKGCLRAALFIGGWNVPFRRRGARALGFAAPGAHNPRMEIKSDNPEHGFQFPGTFELSAMGAADKGLETELPRRLLDAGLEVEHESISWKHSSNGRYVSVRIAFRAVSREQYDLAHQVLRDHPEVKWTL